MAEAEEEAERGGLQEIFPEITGPPFAAAKNGAGTLRVWRAIVPELSGRIGERGERGVRCP